MPAIICETEMRIRNLSDLPIDRPLWKEVAAALQLADSVPAALADDCELYPSHDLQVVIHSVSSAREDGAYSLGRIDVFACEKCTAGHLFWSFLHELIHAWFDSYRRADYFKQSTEACANQFADAVFAMIGGTITDPQDCASYELPRNFRARFTESASQEQLRGLLRKIGILRRGGARRRSKNQHH